MHDPPPTRWNAQEERKAERDHEHLGVRHDERADEESRTQSLTPSTRHDTRRGEAEEREPEGRSVNRGRQRRRSLATCRPVAGIAEPAYQHRVLESLASAQNYIAWLASLARPYLGDDPLEVGAGAGDYAAAWLAGGLQRITLSELDPHLLGELRTGSRVTSG